ncbi:MAG: hypothetical protein GY856_02120 [bacterium]|nr:hypothetical protein [bacterium]
MLQQTNSWPQRGDDHLSPLAADAACDLVTSVSLALTFQPTRAEHLECADHTIVRLRTLLRLAGQLDRLSAGGLRFASGRLREIGRMVVGWRVLETGRGLYDSPHARALAGINHAWPPPGRGLPIGAYTSQLFAAHVYLHEFDHFVKRTLKIPGYARYVDDLFFFGDRRADLRHWRSEVAGWLCERRSLRLKRPQARILSCRGHLDALGYRIRREGVQALPRALRRIGLRVRAAMLPPGNRPRDEDLGRSLAASSGVVLF